VYELYVVDAAGCAFTASYELRQPEPLSVELLDKTDVLCAGESTGSIQIDVKGGIDNQVYQYQWTRDGYLLSVTSQNLNNIPAGIYQATVTDQNGCEVVLSPVTISEPDAPLSIAVEKGDISCYNANDGFVEIG